MEFIELDETVERISAPWESAAVRRAATAACLFGFHSEIDVASSLKRIHIKED